MAFENYYVIYLRKEIVENGPKQIIISNILIIATVVCLSRNKIRRYKQHLPQTRSNQMILFTYHFYITLTVRIVSFPD